MRCKHTLDGEQCSAEAIVNLSFCIPHTLELPDSDSPLPHNEPLSIGPLPRRVWAEHTRPAPPAAPPDPAVMWPIRDAEPPATNVTSHETTQSRNATQRENHVETRRNTQNFVSHGAPACEGLTRHGRPCRMFPSRGESLCMMHKRTADGAAHAAHARTVRAERLTARPSIDLLETVIALNDRTSIQAILDEVIRLSLSGRLDLKRARIVLQACSIAVRNFDPAPQTLAGRLPQSHDWDAYFSRVKAALLTIDPVLREAEDDEVERDA